MNKNYTLKELVKVYAETYCQTGRDAGIKAVLDFIGYELPKNAEREAFDAWCKANHKLATTDQFEAWKAGREELRRNQSLDKQPTEPAWIPWHGGDKSPIIGQQTKFEVKYRDGMRSICTQSQNLLLCWEHRGKHYDIIAYRILD